MTASQTFNIQLNQSPATIFANTSPIANSATTPISSTYPSVIGVNGLVGNVFQVAASINGFTASDPDDVSVLLEAPNGTSVLLLDGAGGTTPSSGLTLNFADANSLASPTAPLAGNGGTANIAPSAFGPNVLTTPLPTPAPSPSPVAYKDQLASFGGGTANGNWSLFVVDNTTGDTVDIANGWTLTITTTPAISTNTGTPATLVIPENNVGGNNSGTVTFNVQDSTGGAASDTVTVTGSPLSLLPTNGITISAGTPNGNAEQ